MCHPASKLCLGSDLRSGLYIGVVEWIMMLGKTLDEDGDVWFDVGCFNRNMDVKKDSWY